MRRLSTVAWLACSVLRHYETQAFSRPSLAHSSVVAVSYRAQDDDSPPILKEEQNHEQDDASLHHDFSKTKWKKKRYVMMKDVDRWIDKDPKKAVRKAQEMIRRMQKLHHMSGIEEYKPNAQAYNLWIHALAKSHLKNAGTQAEAVLEEMQESGVTPNSVTYTSIVDAYAKSGSADQAERALLKLLEEDIDLPISAVDAALNALALESSLDSAERAYTILERLETLNSEKLQPSPHSYSTVMNAFAKCGAAERAHSILERVLEKNLLEPDTVMFNVVIHAWATSGDPRAGTKALALLKEMQQLSETYDSVEPDIVTYNSVLAAWSKSGHVNAGPQAERILKQMQEEDSTVKPNVVSYNSVLHAWSMSSHQPGAAARAQAVLEYMISQEGLEPDVYSFTSVLNAWAKSKEPNKCIRARALLDVFLESRWTLPSAIPFNAVLNACAFSSPEFQREALKIAVLTFKEIRFYTEKDTISYGNLLKCCHNLMPQGQTRTNMVMHIFSNCCDDGLVGDLVWNEIRKAVPSRVLIEQLGLKRRVGNTGLRDLPRSWRRNTRDKQAAQRRSRRRMEESKKEQEQETKPLRHMHNIVEKSYESGRDL